MKTDERLETFIDTEDEWFSGIELRALDLEKELSRWRKSRARPPAEAGRPAGAGQLAGTGLRREAGGSMAGRARAVPEQDSRPAGDRTRTLIDQGRRTARRPRGRRGRTLTMVSAAALVPVTIGVLAVLRTSPSWPPSVATVQSEITMACQNPDVQSEPGQVNFACGKDTSQVLWVFALITSGDEPGYADAGSGRKGLEPITPAQGGEIAWSLNLHHPYNPLNPVDSLQVAARAINNIIAGATLTGTSGSPAAQPGLESDPADCARYTGSPAVITRAGFPSLCASPVSSPQGQAALAGDAYRKWMPGATAVAVQDVSVLFANAGDPGDPQVQAILKTLPGAR
jgi:hypothetical protein